MEKNKVSFKQTMETEDAVKTLQDLVKSLRAGKIVVEQGEAFISMDPAEKVTVEIEGKQKKDKGELSIELSWRLPEAVEEEAALKISATEPQVAPEAKAAECNSPKTAPKKTSEKGGKKRGKKNTGKGGEKQ
jgi:amphi-Trp domain-containing protein